MPRNIVEILRESLDDHPHYSSPFDEIERFQGHVEEVRYKIVIDPSEDYTSRRLMLMFNLFERTVMKTFIIGEFPDDGDLQKVLWSIQYIIMIFCIPTSYKLEPPLD